MAQPPQSTAGSASGKPLHDLMGGQYVDANTGFGGALNFIPQWAPGKGTVIVPVLVGAGGQFQALDAASVLVDPKTHSGYQVGNDLASYTSAALSQSDLKRLGLAGLTIGPGGGILQSSNQSTAGGGGGGGGGSARTAAQEAVDTAQAGYYNALAANMETPAERAAKLEEEKRQNLLNTASDLLRQQQTVREKARESRVTLAGLDPFRFTAALYGQTAAEAPTSYDLQKNNLANITNQQLPTLDVNANVPTLQDTVTKLQGLSQNENNYQNPFGMAGGGTLPMPQFGGVGYGVLVGDRGGINPATEVVHQKPDGMTEVIPLVGHAATGAELPLPNLGAYPDLFGNLRKTLQQTYAPVGSAQNQLGNQAAALGFNLQQNANPQFGNYGALPAGGLGGGYGHYLTLEKGLLDAGVDPAQARQMSDQIGILPTPRAAAQFFAEGKLSPADITNVKSIYKLAGISPDDFDFMVKSAAAPAGQTRRALVYG